ncbi:hypothetical protein Mapa_002130 [Marchantia paleacea]|nr:hypothetical protein Mapa_002130 [Marchantia paleacea]
MPEWKMPSPTQYTYPFIGVRSYTFKYIGTRLLALVPSDPEVGTFDSIFADRPIPRPLRVSCLKHLEAECCFDIDFYNRQESPATGTTLGALARGKQNSPSEDKPIHAKYPNSVLPRP